MKRWIIIWMMISLVLIGCQQKAKQEPKPKEEFPTIMTIDNKEPTKQRVYGEEWDGEPLIVEQKDDEDTYAKVNEITDAKLVAELIKLLKNADWEENVDVDILPADYRFTWNGFDHGVWVNEYAERIELIIEGESNYGVLSNDASKTVFELLTGETLLLKDES